MNRRTRERLIQKAVETVRAAKDERIKEEVPEWLTKRIDDKIRARVGDGTTKTQTAKRVR